MISVKWFLKTMLSSYFHQVVFVKVTSQVKKLHQFSVLYLLFRIYLFEFTFSFLLTKIYFRKSYYFDFILFLFCGFVKAQVCLWVKSLCVSLLLKDVNFHEFCWHQRRSKLLVFNEVTSKVTTEDSLKKFTVCSSINQLKLRLKLIKRLWTHFVNTFYEHICVDEHLA